MFNKFTNSRHILSFMFSQIQFKMKIRSIKFHFTDKFLISYSSNVNFRALVILNPNRTHTVSLQEHLLGFKNIRIQDPKLNLNT